MDLARTLVAVGAGERPASFDLFSRAIDPQWVEAALHATGVQGSRGQRPPRGQCGIGGDSAASNLVPTW